MLLPCEYERRLHPFLELDIVFTLTHGRVYLDSLIYPLYTEFQRG
jgi:hypothetical protein